jgi:hypothetical protein
MISVDVHILMFMHLDENLTIFELKLIYLSLFFGHHLKIYPLIFNHLMNVSHSHNNFQDHF